MPVHSESSHATVPAAEVSDPGNAAAAKDLGEQLLAGQTPQQREIAEKIFDRLKAGADVDDVKELIGDLAWTATVDERRRQHERQASR
jgi:hypothetical protein